MHFGERIKSERNARGWTQKALAEKARPHDPKRAIDQRRVAILEGRKSAKSIYAPALAAAFSMSLDDLLSEDSNHVAGVSINEPPSPAYTISALTQSIADRLEADPQLRSLVLKLVLRYEADRSQGARIAKAIETLLDTR